MRILRSVPNLYSQQPDHSRRFYQDVLGFEVVMDLGWIVTFAAPDQPNVQVSVLSEDPSGLRPALSIEVDDVNAAY